MKTEFTKGLILALSIALLTGCAHTHPIVTHHTHGFFCGLWHGFISPLSFVVSLFSDTITVWDTNNNGGWYTFGFLWGAGIITGGSVKVKYSN